VCLSLFLFLVALSLKRGYTPLIFAAEMGDLDIVRFLLDKGANINATDKAGNTASDHARDNINTDVVTLLEEHHRLRG